jgi:ABC-2 type transport system permease protein
MRNIWGICSKELKSYFASPIAYLLITVYTVIFGYFFWQAISYFLRAGLQMQMQGGMRPMSVNELVIAPILSNMSVIVLFLIPMMTMRLFAEEKNRGTIELLLTSPIRDYELVLGKWLGSLIMFLVIIAIPCINILILFAYGKPDWKPILTGLLGLILQGGAILAIGEFISTTTRNQIIAGSVTFAVVLLLWVLSWLSSEQATWAKVLAYCSVLAHGESFTRGVVELKDVVYFVSVIFFGLFLTERSIESLRWRA